MKTRIVIVSAITTAAAVAASAPILAQTSHGGAAPTGTAVAINDAGYRPASVVVAPGARVVWTNGGSNPHTVTSDTAGQFDSGTLDSRATFAWVAPAEKGTYPYHCVFHSYMRGSVVVSTLSLSGPARAVAVRASAHVHGSAPGVAAGTPVVIESFARGAWTALASTSVTGAGTFAAATPGLTATAELRARIGEDLSPSVTVAVAPKVVAARAGRDRLRVTVTPRGRRTAVLQRLNVDSFRFVTVRRLSIPASGRAVVRVPGRGAFRVTVPATRTLAEASSRVVRVR